MRTLIVVTSEQMLRIVETGIENVNSQYVTADIEAIETGIENANNRYIRANIEVYLHWYREC